MPTKILVASTNPVKLAAVARSFPAMFPEHSFLIEGVSVPSGVSDQPFSDQETLQGALNRATAAQELQPTADFWVGIEGGVQPVHDDLLVFAWIVVKSATLLGKGRTGTFFLPPAVARLVREGKELGEADDIVFNKSNSKQENGAVGLLTGDIIDRTEFYRVAVILALIPFKNEALYS